MSSVPGSKAGQMFNWKGRWEDCLVEVVNGKMTCVSHRLAKNSAARLLRLKPCILRKRQWSSYKRKFRTSPTARRQAQTGGLGKLCKDYMNHLQAGGVH
jgi:hypothetical protein